MAIAYLVSQFPKPSETFVSRELLSLRKLGLELKPFAFDPPSAQETSKLDPLTLELMRGVEYLPNRKLIPDAIHCWHEAVRGWRDNATLQHLSTSKSNQHVRLLRVLALANRLKAAGVTHLHAHWPYATQVAYLVHKLTRIPFSVSIHAHEVEYDYGHFPKVFEALSFASFCNKAAMDRLLSRLPKSAGDRSHLIYHGVDLERFAPLPFPDSTQPLRVISAGRLTRTKGFDRLLRACARFHQTGGRVELTILGQGVLENELKQIAASLNFADHLHLPGWLPHDQISAQLGQAHVFALMADTNFHDGLPNVVLEAMASARPVLLSPLPAAPEALTDRQEGFILKSPQDEEGCARILQEIASTPIPQLTAMGQAARARMETVFDETAHARRLKSLFDQASHEA